MLVLHNRMSHALHSGTCRVSTCQTSFRSLRDLCDMMNTPARGRKECKSQSPVLFWRSEHDTLLDERDTCLGTTTVEIGVSGPCIAADLCLPLDERLVGQKDRLIDESAKLSTDLASKRGMSLDMPQSETHCYEARNQPK